MSLQEEEEANTENIVPNESLYDSVPITPVDIASSDGVKAAEARLYWTYMAEAVRLSREPLTYRLMARLCEIGDDMEVMLLHTESKALRQRLERDAGRYHAWLKYNTRPWPQELAPVADPLDMVFNRAGTDD